MPPERRSPNAARTSSARTIFVEAIVVGSILVSLGATFLAVILFLEQGRVRKVAQDVAPAPPPAPQFHPEPPPEPRPAAAEAVVETPRQPPPPDTSPEIARELEARIAAARQSKAKADLFAFAAKRAADWLRSQANRQESIAAGALDTGEKAAGEASLLRDQASRLADAVARLELKRDDAISALETARTRKGYAILPYRGPNGAWQRPLPIECSRDSAQIMPGGPSFRLIDLELSGLSRNSLFSRIVELAVRKAAAQATPDGNAPTVYVLFIVRPSGIKSYYEARARLQAQGVAFGYELVDESTPIDYPDLGDLSEWPGYVPPEEIAEAVEHPSTHAGMHVDSPSGGAGTGTLAEGSASGEDGLFVWREGLEGRKRIGPGSAGTGSGGVTSGESLGSGGGQTPRVDFGPGTLSQLGRPGLRGSGGGLPGVGGGIGHSGEGPPGTGIGPGSSGIAGSSSGTNGSGRAAVPNLEPPWGTTPDPRRDPGMAAGGAGSGQANSDTEAKGRTGAGEGTGESGTFEGLVAELAAQGGAEAPRSLTRPGAVAILPRDLAGEVDDLTESPFGGGGLGPRPSGGADGMRSGRPSAPPAGRSPFGTQPPTLPRFEPAPNPAGETSEGSGSTDSVAGDRSSVAQANEGTSLGEPNSSRGSLGGSAEPAANGPSSRSTGSSSIHGSGENSPGGQSAASSRGAGGTPSAGQPGQPGAQGAPASGGQPGGDGPRFGLRNGLKRIFGSEERLPEKSWEVSLTCDAGGLTIRPGEHRLNLADLQADPDLLPRTLQAMFERQVRENPERFWRPYVKYRLAAGGEPLMGLSQSQLAGGFVRWPAIVEQATAPPRENTP